MAYCPKCGNTGVRLDGTPCDCQLPTDTIYSDLVGLDIPDQYQGVRFSRALLPLDCGDFYGKTMEELHQQITTLQLSNQNLCICAPPMHGKTIWAYSCIQNLFRQRVQVVPLWDVLELRRMMYDYDMGRSNSADYYDVKYLFLKIPAEVTHQVRTTIATIIDRRVRKGHSTFFIYNGTWSSLTFGDDQGILKGLQGDGSFSSIKVYSFYKKE